NNPPTSKATAQQGRYQKLFNEKSTHQYLKPFAHFLKMFQSCTSVHAFEKKMNTIYQLLDGNSDDLIAYLVEHNFADKKLEALDRKEVDDKIAFVIKRYLMFIDLFFLQAKTLTAKLPYRKLEYLLSLANKFFDYVLL